MIKAFTLRGLKATLDKMDFTAVAGGHLLSPVPPAIHWTFVLHSDIIAKPQNYSFLLPSVSALITDLANHAKPDGISAERFESLRNFTIQRLTEQKAALSPYANRSDTPHIPKFVRGPRFKLS